MVTVSGASENNSIVGEKQQQRAMEKEDVGTAGVSDYELSREMRLRENRERMQKLGIFDLSLTFKSTKPSLSRGSRRKVAQGQDQSPLPQPTPIRRSSRLQNSTPVNYCQSVEKKDRSVNDDNLLREVGSKPEIYTEEHEKLLGSSERSWTLFVDGYGKDGKRIYDPVRGKTCHQCRQKTLGHRTTCSKCNMVQGQFCGDCLYMRYGENVLEANENAYWICPVCRGICNCSLCRQAKGWPPTGTLYRKISRLGYKSVAHYLIQTRRNNPDADKDVGTKVPISSKRSLPFSDVETTGGDDRSKASVVCVNIDPPSEVDKESMFASDSFAESLLRPVVTSCPNDQFENPLNPEPQQGNWEYGMEIEATGLLPGELDERQRETKMAIEPQNDQIPPASNNCHGDLPISKTCERGNDNEIMNMDNEDVCVLETSPKSTKKRVFSQPTSESIAGRLRQRSNSPKTAPRKAKDTLEITDGDSIASRLKKRRRT